MPLSFDHKAVNGIVQRTRGELREALEETRPLTAVEIYKLFTELVYAIELLQEQIQFLGHLE